MHKTVSIPPQGPLPVIPNDGSKDDVLGGAPAFEDRWSPDPGVQSAPRPFPFDPPTRLDAETNASRRYPTVPAQRILVPRAQRPRGWRGHISPLSVGVLVLALGVGAGLGLRAAWSSEDEPTQEASPSPTQLKEYDIDQPGSGPVQLVTVQSGRSVASQVKDRPSSKDAPDGATVGQNMAQNIAQAAPSQGEPALTLSASSEVTLARPEKPKSSVPASPGDSETVLIQRAFSGDDSALLQLELKASRERTFKDVVALAEGREEQARREAKELAQQFIRMKDDAPDQELVSKMLDAAGDPYAYREAQLGLAQHPSALGSELLFEVARRNRHNETIAEFAQMLLASESVYERASPALQIAIDGFTTHDCKSSRALLMRAQKGADRRAVFTMAKFARQTGCGAEQNEDCYPCLRNDDLLVDALRAARLRTPK